MSVFDHFMNLALKGLRLIIIEINIFLLKIYKNSKTSEIISERNLLLELSHLLQNECFINNFLIYHGAIDTYYEKIVCYAQLNK